MSLIVLIGVAGSGKTTVARELSRRYELPLYEVDEAVEERLGAPMRTLVVGRDPRLGATAREEAERLLSLDEGIVTLGASAPLDPATASSIERARANGAFVIELSADLSAVSRREGLGAPRSVGLGAPRAVLTQLMKQAREVYASVADTTVDTSACTPQEVADLVARACKLTPDY